MSDRASELYAALVAARTADEVCEAVACAVWHNVHDGAKCPPEHVPTWEQLITFDFPPKHEAVAEVLTLLEKVLGVGARWTSWGTANELCFYEGSAWRNIVIDESGRSARFRLYTIAELHAEKWCAAAEPVPRHPLAPLVAAWQQRPKALDHVHVLGTQSRAGDTVLTRMPGLLALATTEIETVEVDREPLVTLHPDGTPRRRYRVREPKQGELWPAPRKLEDRATAGAVLDSIAQVPLTGDARNPLRAQMVRAGTLGYALTAPVRLTTAEWTEFLTGRDTPENRAAALTALRVFRYLEIDCGAGPWSAFDAELGPVHHFGPPRWWLDATGPRAYRLTGALFRSVDTGPGRKATRWGALERTIAGLEGALLWSTGSAGKGRHGRLPNSVRPVVRGKAGAPVSVPWALVLRLSGEHVPDETTRGAPDSSASRRYRRRMDSLRTAGYFLPTRNGRPVLNADARAGDTIEIVRQVKGGRGHEAGIEIRATARFCAAYAEGEQTRVPARSVLIARS
ncbi:MAG: hypothetical protein OXC12_17960 [Spirochaetaceae bacterium]|nr:hypothetical protein [Spirochaetaceae bacterium]